MAERFGSGDVLDDGREVISEWFGTRLWIGSQVADMGFKLLFLRASLSLGSVFTVGTDQNSPIIRLVKDLVAHVTVGASAGNNASVIRAVPEGVEVGWMPSSTTWMTRRYTPDLVPIPGSDRNGTCPNTSQGIIDFAPNGSLIISASPIDRPCGTSPYKVRLGVERGATSAGQVADGRLPDGVIMSRNGVAGTLAHGPLIEEVRVSTPGGQFWIGRMNHARTMASGSIPATGVPPLVTNGPIEPPIPPIPPEPSTMVKYPRPIFFACYDSASTRYGVNPAPIGNVMFPDKEYVKTTPGALILAQDTYINDAGVLNRTLYYYAHAGGSGLESAKEQYQFLHGKTPKPIILYLDSRDWSKPLPSWVDKQRTFLAVQAYPNPGESVEAFKTAMFSMCESASRHKLPLVLTPCFYDRNGTLSIIEITKHMPTYDALVDAFHIVGIMPFSDMRKGTLPDGRVVGGMAVHDELYTYANREYAAVPMRPNRYSYWTPPSEAEAKQALIDQVHYAASAFSPTQADDLSKLIEEHYGEDTEEP